VLFRSYTLSREGTARSINTDYMDVMHRHFAKVDFHNALEDFQVRIADQYDEFSKLPETDQKLIRAQSGGMLVPGKLYTLPDGRVARGWQLDPGRNIFPVDTVNMKILAQAALKAFDTEDYKGFVEGLANTMVAKPGTPGSPTIAGPRGGSLFGEAAALGGYRQVRLLEEPVHDTLMRIRNRPGEMDLIDDASGLMRLWKRGMLTWPGLPLQVKLGLSHAAALYREDPAAFLKLPQAVQLLAGKGDPSLMESVKEQGILSHSSPYAPLKPTNVSNMLQHADIPWLSKLNYYANPYRWLQNIASYRGDAPRVAKFMADLDRIQKGVDPKTSSVNVAGLEPIAAAGKIAREFDADYGSSAPGTRALGALFPFSTYAIKSLPRWVMSVKNDPVGMAAKFGLPMLAAYMWNNTGDRQEVEKQLPEWLRAEHHIILTDFQGKPILDDRGRPSIFHAETSDLLTQRIIGTEKIFMYASDVMNGTKTPQEAGKFLLKDMALGLPRMAERLENPAIKAYTGLLSNTNPFTKTPIVPDRLVGTDQGKALQHDFFWSQVWPVYSVYARSEHAQDRMFPAGDTESLVMKGLKTAAETGVRMAIPYSRNLAHPDLAATERGNEYNAVAALKSAHNQALADIEDSWVVQEVTGQGENFDRDLDKAVNQGLDEKTIESRLESPRVQRRIAEEKLRLAKDPAEIKRLRSEISDWRDVEREDFKQRQSQDVKVGMAGQ
jgi:hypothetical protein